MKIKTGLLAMSILIAGTSMVAIAPAQAGNGTCEASDPCGLWAAVDSQGVVQSSIVCTQSMCGETGEWKGVDPNSGLRLVPQIASNPETHDTSGLGGYRTETDNSVVVKESNGTFTVSSNSENISTVTETDSANGAITTTTVTVAQTKQSFTYADTINMAYKNIIMKQEDPDYETKAEVTVNKKFLNNLTEEERIVFLHRETEQGVKDKIIMNNFQLMLDKLKVIIEKLNKWVIKP
jgi:hypothetical protein